MNRARGLTMGVRAVLLAVLAILCAEGIAHAQGNIAGQVRDARTGETLIGVNIIAVGTASGAATDFDGRYRIEGLRPGEYNLRVSYVGYESRLYTGIRVQSGETTPLNIELEEAVLAAEDEVVIIGERPLIDVEQSTSSFAMTRDQIDATPVRAVQEVASMQVGVMSDPTGLYIRGGRAYETGFFVDGVSARDPLAGTGFGLDIGSAAFSEVEVTTGGVGAEHGDVTSGVVSVRTQEGTDQFRGTFAHKRDNFGSLNQDWNSNFMEDLYEFTLGGPVVRGRLRFFVSGQAQLEDGFTRRTATPNQLGSSLISNDAFLPRAGNRWSGLGKLTYELRSGMKLEGSYQRSLTVNQNTRMLQVTGNEAVIRPGFQYAFVLQPDNANTYAHDSNISYVRWTHVLDPQSFYEVQASRLFTRLRADANGRPWRPDIVDTELDPESIVTFPANIFVNRDGRPPDPNAVFVLPGPGFINNMGLATRWHDHFAEELTLRSTYTRFSADRALRIVAGFEAKFNDYQWIDVIRPWVGAPVITASGDTTQSNRLGQSSDIWRVRPWRGGVFAESRIRYRGLVANVGARLEYWAPGRYVDEMVDNPDAPILDGVREQYRKDTFGFLGRRMKLRMLPKVRVSFPIRDNQVLFFNYGHSTQLPHPTFVYAGLDPFYQSRSFFADLGNPNLNPEVDISYELGFRNQITSNDALNITAFWRDKFDFITVEDIVIRDLTGRETVRAFRVNGDFARIRGLEVSYLKRIGRRFQGQISASYSQATGLSSTSNDALVDFLARGDIETMHETPLAWDRPLDVKSSVTYSHDAGQPLLGVPGLNRFRVYLSSTFRSGQRYTPVEFRGHESNPFTGELDWRPIYETVSDPARRFANVGQYWWWFDLSVQRSVPVFGNDLRLTMEVTNLFNQRNGIIVNPVTGKPYPDINPNSVDWEALRGDSRYDVPNNLRDPRYEDPNTSGLPPYNPARFLPQRHVVFGLAYRF